METPLSFTGRRWVVQNRTASMDLPALLAQERMIRLGGMREQVRLSDPFLFPEMGRALERMQRAMETKERVGIFGDYDADGITGTVQLTRMFRRHGIDPVVHLPHREREGYGLRPESIDSLVRHNVTLLVTIDTGINAQEEIAYAMKNGMDVIVTDHHVATNGRPSAYAVLHPRIPVDVPNTDLTGSGVALMLVRAMELLGGQETWEGADEDLALAAIGTIADMGALRGENRTLVMYGLHAMKRLPESSPLKMLMNQARIDGRALTSTDIGFRLAPRINASGRMADPRISFDALLGDIRSLQELEELNEKRQRVTHTLFEELKANIDDSPFICIAQSDLPVGIVGLLAGKLTERYGRPSFIGSVKSGICTASLRSIPGVNLMKFLCDERIKPLLLRSGGHSQAAGCTVQEEDLHHLFSLLKRMFTDEEFPDGELLPNLTLHATMDKNLLTIPFVQSLSALAPFGEGNQEPRFLLSDVELTMLRRVGNDASHLSCNVLGKKAIGFRMGDFADELANERVDLACTLSLQTWNGREELQVVIEDIRKS